MATAKQIAWRKKFAEMARAGTLTKGKKKAKPKAKRNPTKALPPKVRANLRVKSGYSPATRSNPQSRDVFPYHIVNPDTGTTIALVKTAQVGRAVAQALADAQGVAFGVWKK